MNVLRASLLAVLLLATGSGAVVAAREVVSARDGVESVRLAAQSESVATIDPAMSRLLAVAAWRAAPTPEARRGLIATLTRPLTAVLRGHRNGVNAVAYDREGTRLATGGVDGTLRIWDARSYRPIGLPIKGHRGAITQVTFAKNGWVITAGQDRTIRVWEIADEEETGKQVGRPIPGTVFAADPPGRFLALGDQNGVPRLVNLLTRRPSGQPFPRHPAGLRHLSFDGTTLTTYDGAGVLRRWDARTRRPAGRIAGGPGPVTLNRERVALTLRGTLRRLDLATRRQSNRPVTGDFVALTYAAEGDLLATAQRNGAVHVLENGVPLTEPFQAGAVRAMAFSPDGNWLATAGDDEIVRVWDIALTRRLSGEPTSGTPGPWTALAGTPPCRAATVDAVATSPDGRQFATASAGAICLWDAATRRRLREPLTGHTGRVNTLVYSPDGRRLLSGGDDHTIRSWDTATGEPGDLNLAQASGISALAFDPRDPNRLATGTENGTVRLWDLTERLPVGPPFLGHTAAVTSIAFSGSLLATAAGNIRLWDLDTHRQLGSPLGRNLSTVEFANGGRELVGGGPAGTRRLWNPALTPDPAAEACALARRFPPPPDLRSYLPDRDYPDICP
ncbi:WD40 repeat domain-containing protein [Acrocarpospora phusangensis]|uniref:WD40 repeat domain-containing protein n=1 Tax=Acrocarpospora phusangensis TaxID=1070424 RepID=UPI00194F69A6|nr:WD40 repeat domain-containing protein [Acrocarpospora phusangensis]